MRSGAGPAAGARARNLEVVPYAGDTTPGVNLDVRFATASDKLTKADQALLDTLAKALKTADLAKDRFAVAGHDRGGRCAYRMALDHADRVTRLAVLDIIPTGEAFGRTDKAFAMGYWHWFFLAQPAPLPERLIGADPDWFWRWHTNRVPREFFDPAALEDYLTCFRNPETVRAICEDYRAAATIDCEHDAADKQAGRRIRCPVLALWGAQAKLEAWYDTLAVWREWADDVRGRALPCGHYLPEEVPAETLAELTAFFSG